MLSFPAQQQHLIPPSLSLSRLDNTPLQLGLADFIHCRAYRQHLNKLRFTLAQQVDEYRNFMIEIFKEINIKITQPQGGYCLWMQLPTKIKGIDIYKFAQQQGINIVPGEVFSSDEKYSNFIRLNAGYPLNPRIRSALVRLTDWLQAQ